MASLPPVPVVTITTDSNNDFVLSQAELAGLSYVTATVQLSAADLANKGSVRITVIDDLVRTDLSMTSDGSILGLTNGITAKYDSSTGLLTLRAPIPGNDHSISVTATQYNVAGKAAGSGSDQAVGVENVAPPIADLDPASDSGLKGDRITNDSTPTISGSGMPGYTIKLTFPSGEVLSTTVDDNGLWRITPTQALSEGSKQVSAVAIDEFGNTSEPALVNLIIDTHATAPRVTITTDSNNDGSINNEELAGVNQVQVRIALVGDERVGDILTINALGGPEVITLSAADLSRGYFDRSYTAPGQGQNIQVSASIHDIADNQSAISSDQATGSYAKSAWLVADTSATEGQYLVFRATLNHPAIEQSLTRIDFSNGTGTIGSDTANWEVSLDGGQTWNTPILNGNFVRVPAGQTDMRVRLNTVNDGVYEGNETVAIKVTEQGDSALFDLSPASAIGTIVDAQSAPTWSISNASTTEGGMLVWTATLSADHAAADLTQIKLSSGSGSVFNDLSGATNRKFEVSIDGGTSWTTTQLNNSADANSQWANISTPGGVNRIMIRAQTTDDQLAEGSEQLTISIQGSDQAGGASSRQATGNGTINDNEKAAWHVLDASATEGQYLVFRASLDHPASVDSWTRLEFTNGSGTVGTDTSNWQVSLDGGVTWNTPIYYGNMVIVPAGQTDMLVRLNTVDERVFEGNETISIKVSELASSNIFDPTPATATGTIIDVDAPPIVSDNGQVNGTEDTPLLLKWADFHISDPDVGDSLSVKITRLPADGTLQAFIGGAWQNIAAGALVSKAEVDAGHLRFVPDPNESGEHRYSLAGLGNMHFDYAEFGYQAYDGQLLSNAANMTVDITPLADRGNLSVTSEWIYSNDLGDAIANNAGVVYSWTQYETFKFNVSGSSGDLDGSEKLKIGFTLSSPRDVMLADGSHVQPDGNGVYWVDAKAVVWVAYGNEWTAVYSLYVQEVNQAGQILDTQVIANSDVAHARYGNWGDPGFTLGQISPIVLDLDGNGVQTVAVEHGVQFDLQDYGHTQKTGWTDGKDGFLVMDRNHDGQINNGSELFGEATRLADGTRADNGFMALREQDSNHDGVVDGKDANFNELQVWVDANQNGTTEEGELHHLDSLGITSLDLNTSPSDEVQNGNILGLVSNYSTVDGAQHAMVDVWFAYQNDQGIMQRDPSSLLAQNNAALVPNDTLADSSTVPAVPSDTLSVSDNPPLAEGGNEILSNSSTASNDALDIASSSPSTESSWLIGPVHASHHSFAHLWDLLKDLGKVPFHGGHFAAPSSTDLHDNPSNPQVSSKVALSIQDVLDDSPISHDTSLVSDAINVAKSAFAGSGTHALFNAELSEAAHDWRRHADIFNRLDVY